MHFRKNDMIGNCLNKGSSIAMKKTSPKKLFVRQDARAFLYKKWFNIIPELMIRYCTKYINREDVRNFWKGIATHQSSRPKLFHCITPMYLFSSSLVTWQTAFWSEREEPHTTPQLTIVLTVDTTLLISIT